MGGDNAAANTGFMDMGNHNTISIPELLDELEAARDEEMQLPEGTP